MYSVYVETILQHGDKTIWEPWSTMLQPSPRYNYARYNEGRLYIEKPHVPGQHQPS